MMCQAPRPHTARLWIDDAPDSRLVLAFIFYFFRFSLSFFLFVCVFESLNHFSSFFACADHGKNTRFVCTVFGKSGEFRGHSQTKWSSFRYLSIKCNTIKIPPCSQSHLHHMENCTPNIILSIKGYLRRKSLEDEARRNSTTNVFFLSRSPLK